MFARCRASAGARAGATGLSITGAGAAEVTAEQRIHSKEQALHRHWQAAQETAGVATYSITGAGGSQETAGAVTYSIAGAGARFVTGAGAVLVWAGADANYSITGARSA